MTTTTEEEKMTNSSPSYKEAPDLGNAVALLVEVFTSPNSNPT